MSVRPAGPAWWEAVRDRATVAEVAAALGMVDARRGIGPCPACNADRRGGNDPRPPMGATGDGHGWSCFRCKATGDAVDLAALRLAGAKLRELTAERRADVRAWFAERGWCDAAGGLSPLGMVAAELFGEVPPKGDPRWRKAGAELRRREAADPPPAVTSQTGADTARKQNGRPERNENRTMDAPKGPPPEEVAALWGACGRVDVASRADPAVTWLEQGRALDCRELAALDLVRLMPAADGYPWPRWIPRVGMDLREWCQLYRLAVPMYDARGELRALRFRAVDRVREVDPDADPPRMRWRAVPVDTKALAPVGARIAGMVLADPPGLAMLRGEYAGGDLGKPGEGWDGSRVVICEGEPDTWTAATVARRTPDRWREGRTWATLGVVAGSWTADLAARVPDGAEVAVLTHDDEAGDKYAERIRETLTGRCAVLRAPSTDGGRDGSA